MHGSHSSILAAERRVGVRKMDAQGTSGNHPSGSRRTGELAALSLIVSVTLLTLVLAPGSVAMGGSPARGAIAHHALHAGIDPATAQLTVVDTMTITHENEVPVSLQFPFLLAKELELQEVAGVGLDVTASETRLRPRDYWHRPPYDELDGYQRSRTINLTPEGSDGVWPESLRVIIRYSGAVYDSLQPPASAYARGFETTAGLVDPRGAFLSWSTFWIPERPDERFTFRCALETPADWHGVSQGALVSSEIVGDRRINFWDSPQLMEEIYFVAGPYTLRREARSGVEVMTFTYANTEESICRRYIDGTERYLRLYEEKIGPYPFAKFALVENFWQTGFGMPSFTLLGDRVIRLPFILDTSYGHEILHNWWGNGVFVDYETGNWCEGLTAYGADYLYKLHNSEEQARDYRRTALQSYSDYVSDIEDFPLRLFRQRHDYATQAIGYSKSMMVFHQLRLLIGEEGFWDALRGFYRDHLFQRASWDDLYTYFEEQAGRDLGHWKEQWLERQGAPSLKLKDYRISQIDADRYTIEVTIAQSQEALYDLLVPVVIGWGNPEGKTSELVALTDSTATVQFEVERAPDWISVDPEYEVLRKIDPGEIPPALSRTLGADTAVVVLADGLSTEIASAYRSLAEQWQEGARLAVLEETELSKKGMPDVPVWFFGFGQAARLRFREIAGAHCMPPAPGERDWILHGTEYGVDHGIVLAGGPAADPKRAWSLIDAVTPEQVAEIGRKVPHYGKYGYLVFEGGRNILSGSWSVKSSPLQVHLVRSE
jgi:hypothetical protein